MNQDPAITIKVLIADDDPIFAALAETCLKQAGYCVDVVHDGAVAFEALNAIKYDAAIVDLAMPRIDGFRLIALVRATPKLENLPLIVLSSRNDVDAVEEAYRLGANAFETKPVNWTLLPTHLRHVIRSAATLAALKDTTKKFAATAGR